MLLRWILTLCGLRRERSETRCPRQTVKLEVEHLTERILPSASSVDVEAMSQMVSTVTQVISTVENEVSSDLQMIGQEVAEEIAYVEQHFFGIVPNAQNPSLATTVPQAGSGSGSGSGVTTTTHNGQNQPLQTITSKSGSGSGSGATTAAHENIAKQGGVRLLAGSGSGSVPGDVYTWDPPDYYPNPGGGSGSAPGSTPGDLYASDPRNWLKNGNPQLFGSSGSWTIPGNKAGDSVVFDSSYAYGSKPIIWDQSFVFSTMNINPGGYGPYTALQTVDAGIELTGANGSGSLNMDGDGAYGLVARQAAQPMAGGGGSVLNQNLKGNVKVDGNEDITNWNLTTSGNFQYIINGGTTNLGGGSGYTDNIGATITINSGATLQESSYSPLKFTAANVPININSGGTMTVYYGTGGGITILDNGGQAGDYLNVNGGTLNYKGSAGVTDKFIEPVLVSNDGTFNVTTVSGGINGHLTVAGQTGQTQKYSVYMTGGSVNLSNQVTLECDDDYKQTDGTLQSTDATLCILQDGPNMNNGTAVIAGGKLVINGGKGSGEFGVQGNLDFAGTLVVGIQGDKSGFQGYLNVTGSLNQLAGNFLFDTVNGQLGIGNWVIVYTTGNIQKFGGNAGGLTQVPKGGNLELTNP